MLALEAAVQQWSFFLQDVLKSMIIKTIGNESVLVDLHSFRTVLIYRY